MNGTSKIVSRLNIAVHGEAFNSVWYDLQNAHAALSMNVSMYQCQQVHLSRPCLFQRCVSLLLGPDGCAHIWHLLLGFLIVVGLCFMPCIMFQNVHDVSNFI